MEAIKARPYGTLIRENMQPMSGVRIIEQRDGPTIKLNTINYTPARGQFKITLLRNKEDPKPPGQEEASTSRSIDITSNNHETQSRRPSDNIEIVVESGLGPPTTIWASRFVTGSELHQLVKRRLKIASDVKIHMIRPTHVVVHDSDERNLWSFGFRNIPNHITVTPEEIARGDQVLMTYKGKGPNVNSGYEPDLRSNLKRRPGL